MRFDSSRPGLSTRETRVYGSHRGRTDDHAERARFRSAVQDKIDVQDECDFSTQSQSQSSNIDCFHELEGVLKGRGIRSGAPLSMQVQLTRIYGNAP